MGIIKNFQESVNGNHKRFISLDDGIECLVFSAFGDLLL
jgi:hypothetical protein